MKVQVLNKVISLTCRLLLSVLLVLFCANGATAEEAVRVVEENVDGVASASLAFISSYQKHHNAQYAVRWSASAHALAMAREKMARYSYLVLYTSKPLLSESNVSVIQFGFFKNQAEANDFVSANERAFPGLKAVSVSGQEHSALFSSGASEEPALVTKHQDDYYWLSPSTERGLKSVKQLLKQAKTYYINKDYTQALKYYGVLSLTQDEDTAVWSREIMAVCLERLGRRDEALESYKNLVSDYPDAKSSGRIAQRLRALETAASDDKSRLRKSKMRQEDKAYWRGTFGQTYYQITRDAQGGRDSDLSIDAPQIPSHDQAEDRDLLSALITNFDLNAGVRFGGSQLELRLNGYDFYDMRDEESDVDEPFKKSNDSRTAIKRFYAKYKNEGLGLSAVMGRQKDINTGMYMSFDGGTLKYDISEHWAIGASAGIPVYLSELSDDFDRQFYSLFGRYDSNKRWSISGYFTQQSVFEQIERSAFGGALKYTSETFNSYLNVDYDLEFEALNVLRWSGTYLFSKKSQTTLSYGFQRAPFLTASNILVGQPRMDLEARIKSKDFDYRSLFGEALDRTSLYEYGSLSHRYRVDENLQFVMDLYHSRNRGIARFLSDDEWETSYPVQKNEYYLYSSAGIQAIAYGFFGQNDTAVLSFRQSESTNSTSSLVRVSERVKFGKRFSIQPKVSFKNIDRKGQEAGQTSIRGSISLNYKPVRSAEIRAEFGSEVIEGVEDKGSVHNTYFNLGYQARF